MKIRTQSRRGWFIWVAVGLLVIHVTGMVTAVTIALGDRTFVALPDYYAKAIRWDQSQEELRKSEALQWTREVSLSDADANGARRVRVTMKDRVGTPVVGLKLAAVAYPEVLPTHQSAVQFIEMGAGIYEGRLESVEPGPLVIEVRGARFDELYVARVMLTVGGAK